MSVLAVAFTETPKETVFTDPQRRVNGVPLFYTCGSEGMPDLQIGYLLSKAARHEGCAWIKHLTDIFSHSQRLPLFPFAKKKYLVLMTDSRLSAKNIVHSETAHSEEVLKCNLSPVLYIIFYYRVYSLCCLCDLSSAEECRNSL